MSHPTVLNLATGFVDLTSGEAGLLTCKGHLPALELALLQELHRAEGEVVPRGNLVSELWGEGADERRLDGLVARLRDRIEVDPKHPFYLRTVFGEGYQLTLDAPVVLSFPSVTIDLGRREIRRGGQTQRLTTKEAEVLTELYRHQGSMLSREALQRAVWGVRRLSNRRYVDYVIHGLRKKLEVDPSNPAILKTIPGAGYCLEKSGAPARPHTVLEPASTFFGRSQELEVLGDALNDGRRWVLLHGTSGVGKSRLAVRFARLSVEAEMCSAAWVCSLRDSTSRHDLLDRIARDMAVEEVKDLPGLVAHQKRPILIFDNLEQLDHQARQALDDVIRSVPGALCIGTSRSLLGLPGEVRVSVPPLDVHHEAVDLFLDRARTVDPRLVEDRTVAARVAAHFDGIPLALELAAGRARVLGLQGLVERFDQRFAVAKTSRGDDKETSLWHAIEWSWSLLDVTEQQGLAQLSLLHTFSLEDAEQVLNQTRPALDVIDTLVEHSMLEVVRTSGLPRFGFLRSIREVAQGHLGERDHERTTQRMIEWFRRWGTQEATARAWRSPELLAAKLGDLDNLILSLRAAMGLGDAESAHLVLRAALDVVEREARGSAGRLEEALANDGQVSQHWRVRFERERGNLSYMRGDLDGAAKHALRALHGAEVLEEPELRGRALMDLARLEWRKNAFEAAIDKYCAAQVLFDAIDDGSQAGICHGQVGNIAWDLGQGDLAEDHWLQAMSLFQNRGGYPLAIMATHMNLATCCRARGDQPGAREHLNTVLVLTETTSASSLVVAARVALANLDLRDDLQGALRHLDAAMEADHDGVRIVDQAHLSSTLAEAMALRGHPGEAWALHQEAIELLEDAERDLDLPQVWLRGARIALVDGDKDKARGFVAEIERFSPPVRDPQAVLELQELRTQLASS